MNIAFHPSALADAASARHLTALYWLVVEGRHQWVVRDPAAICDSRWLQEAGRRVVRGARELAMQSARKMQTAAVEIIPVGQAADTAHAPWKLPADIAERALRRPVAVLVENARCDGAFFRLLMLRVGERRLKRALGEESFRQLRQAWGNPLGDGAFFEVRHGGGSTLPHQLALMLEASPTFPPSILIVVDSDRDRPRGDLGGTASQAQAAVTEAREGMSSALHSLLELRILQKREVENYLPRSVLLRRLRAHRLQWWEAASEEERDHEDLKARYTNDLWKVLLEPRYQRELYAKALVKRAGDKGRELHEIIEAALSLL